jgi:hypothetical protein
MDSISRDGAGFRTRLLDRTQADRFAQCLRGNPRFTRVDVQESARAKDPTVRFFVAFAPASAERQAAIFHRAQDARETRGEEQADGYEVFRDPSGRFFWVWNVRSGDVYEVTLRRDCTCPDSHHRTQHLPGAFCKHHRIVEVKLERNQVQEFVQVLPAETPEARRARIRRDRELLWG